MRIENSFVQVDGGRIEVTVQGYGPLVVMVPSAGRGAADFDDLARRVADVGYRVVRPEPRGIGGTTAPIADLTMATLADDCAEVITMFGDGPAVLVGHAFGNRVARMAATEHPTHVRSVALLACGGSVPPSERATASLAAVFDDTLPADEHLDHVRRAFFAPGNDPSIWVDGWYGEAAFWQGRATRALAVEHWWAAGTAPLLVLQPADDVIAVPANARELADRLGDRVELHTIERAGHALLPEQPDEVAARLIDWLHRASADSESRA